MDPSHVKVEISVVDSPSTSHDLSNQLDIDVRAILDARSNAQKNAGRKKSNPAWEFFVDLRETAELPLNGIKCKYCSFRCEDRSPNVMRSHLKKEHDTGPGGLFDQLERKYRDQSAEKVNRPREVPPFYQPMTWDGTEIFRPPSVEKIKKKKNVVKVLNDSSGYAESILARYVNNMPDNLSNDLMFNTSQNITPVINATQFAEMISKMKNETSEETVNNESKIKLEPVDTEQKDQMDTSSVQNSTIGSLAFTTQSQISQNITIQSDFGPSTSVTEGPDNSTTEDNQPPSYTWNNLSSDVYIEPYRPRNANNWIHLGRFETEADMHKMRCKERVSKRRTEQLKNGTKVRYRCNKWKRTKCAFQMYAWFSNGKIDLYESGIHDHSGQKMALHKLRMQSKGLLPPGTKLPQPPPQPILSQEDILNNLLQQATSQHGNQEIVTVHASVLNNHGGQATSGMDTCDDEPAKKNIKYEEDNPTTQLLNAANAQYGFQQKESEKITQCDQHSAQVDSNAGNSVSEAKAKHAQNDVQKAPLGQFTLADNFLKQHLTLVAHELDLQMTFLSPPGSTAECLIRSKNPLFSKRAILLKEESDGKSLLVCDLHKDKVAHEERWIKGDQPQFVWAVRGKCSHRLWMQLSIQKARYSNSRTAQNHIEIGSVNAQNERLDNKKALERMNQITGSGFYESMTLKKFVNICGQQPKSYEICLDTDMSPLESNDQK